ncbi:hypothetical protein D3C72_1976020 [compost metagenome]
MKRTDRPGLCSPARPGWNRPITPCRCSPARSKMIFVLPSSIGSLSDGTSGTPRHVRNWEPNRLTVGGGTPRRVHSRPKAAMASGCVRKKPGSFHTFVSSSSRSSGVGAPVRVKMRWSSCTLASRP